MRQKLNELENQRRVGAESKAAIYLTAITALAPVLVSLVPGIISSGGNNAFVDFCHLQFLCMHFLICLELHYGLLIP